VRAVTILFARAPVPGHAKTRLAKALGPESAASLHAAFVADVIEAFQRHGNSDLELHTDTLSDAWQLLDVARKLQISGGLELKMFHALNSSLQAGYESVAIVGTDAPTLPPTHVEDLLTAKEDIALGPSEDGGFYAIAARKIHPAMFAGVEWSRPDTLVQTLSALKACGLSIVLGKPWFDVDEIADLGRLLAGPLPRHTAAWVRANLSLDFSAQQLR
jgi:rSAM/selenodomain-associated transferase 1